MHFNYLTLTPTLSHKERARRGCSSSEFERGESRFHYQPLKNNIEAL
jgi:hypothetical protein